MLVLLILTIINISKEGWKAAEDDDDLTVSIIQLVGICKENYMPWGYINAQGPPDTILYRYLVADLICIAIL